MSSFSTLDWRAFSKKIHTLRGYELDSAQRQPACPAHCSIDLSSFGVDMPWFSLLPPTLLDLLPVPALFRYGKSWMNRPRRCTTTIAKLFFSYRSCPWLEKLPYTFQNEATTLCVRESRKSLPCCAVTKSHFIKSTESYSQPSNCFDR